MKVGYTKSQLIQDLKFLTERLNHKPRYTGNERGKGLSADTIVAIAYGLASIEDLQLPSDLEDVQACENTWKKLPGHRKTGEALKAMGLVWELCL